MVQDHTRWPMESQRQIVSRVLWDGILAALGEGEAAARLAAGPLPWPDVLDEARRLRVTSLLYAALQAAPSAAVPPEVQETLRRGAAVAAARATILERACADVMAAASGAGIPVLVLKGVALAALVYPPGVVRSMDDADLLVPGPDRNRLAEILRAKGYRNDLRGEEDFFDPGRSYSLDLHTGPLNTTRVPARGALWPVAFEDLWNRGQDLALGAVAARTLGRRDTVTHLALHAVHHHGLTGALWMVDLLACLRRWPLAPEGLAAAPPPVRQSLWYCLEVLAARGQDPAPGLRAALRPPHLLPGEARLLAAASRGALPEGIRYALTLRCLPHWRDQAAFLRQILLPSSAVHSAGFGDAPGPAPGRTAHWRAALRLTRQSLRALLPGGGTPGRGPHVCPDLLGGNEEPIR